jgi:hypothetical protein
MAENCDHAEWIEEPYFDANFKPVGVMITCSKCGEVIDSLGAVPSGKYDEYRARGIALKEKQGRS